MADNYGIVTFDNEGPINTWERLASVQAHNNRDRSEPHCDPDGPKPLHFVGRGNLVDDVKTRLREHDIDPAGLRKNGNIAFEVVLSASRSFFQAVTEDERWDRISDFVMAARKAADAAWGRFRIVSLVLHLDEYTPHIHVVILPLIKKVYERWSERGEVWALVGRTICGPGEYQRVHDVYAEHMASIGLKRGASHSRAKYRPYADEIADLEAEKTKAAEAQSDAVKAAQASRDEHDRCTAEWRQQFDRQEQIKAEQETKAKELESREAALRKAILLQEVRQREFARRAEELDAQRSAVESVQVAAEKKLVVLTRTMAALNTAADQASCFAKALLPLPLDQLPPAAIDVLKTISGYSRAAELIDVPDNDALELPIELQHQLLWLKRGRRSGG